MPECTRCDDTGVWETGNNDLPCPCPAGDTALFNVAGVPFPVSGRQIKRNDAPYVPEGRTCPNCGHGL